MRRRANRRTYNEHKSSRVTRRLDSDVQVSPANAAAIKKLLGK